MFEQIAIIGAQGAIGKALLNQASKQYPNAEIHAFTRHPQPDEELTNVYYHNIDYEDEISIAKSAKIASEARPLDLIIVSVGILHQGNIQPEKSANELSATKFETVFKINTILPAIIAKHFLPRLAKDHRAVFAALSARVGSITDNRLGGWYAYRASKAALNMIIKNLSIEMRRLHKNAIIIGLHPGTVDTPLSAPYHQRIPKDKIFTPKQAAEKLCTVIESIDLDDSGTCIAWDGSHVEP